MASPVVSSQIIAQARMRQNGKFIREPISHLIEIMSGHILTENILFPKKVQWKGLQIQIDVLF